MTDNQNNPQPHNNVQYVAISADMLQANSSPSDERDLRELWNAIWAGKWIIVTITTVFAIASVFYALSLPNIYKSEALLAPASEEQQGGLGGLVGQFGGLASLAGVNLGGGKANKTALAIEIIKSRAFFTKFLEKHNILPDLMAVKSWDLNNRTIIYNDKIYLQDNAEWVRQVTLPKKAKPSTQEAKKVFDSLLNIQEKGAGMIVISLEHVSPQVAKQWIDWLIQDINLNMKMRDKQEAEKSIIYLQSQVGKTTIFEHKTLLFQLIEEQTKTLMFAEVRDEYTFKTIDPALIPELKFKPKRVLIVALGLLLGGILSILIVFTRYFSAKS
jgi:uncharacterized protein involved in exopolysaccharide biosynthesis